MPISNFDSTIKWNGASIDFSVAAIGTAFELTPTPAPTAAHTAVLTTVPTAAPTAAPTATLTAAA